jgi:cytochrome c oxidase subunit I+III
VFFLLGGVLALVMRLQLARPAAAAGQPEFYNQLFTMHGTTMMFLFAVPVMQAVAMYLVPLMIGARSVAFPRMNAFAFWIFVMGGAFLYTGFLLGSGPEHRLVQLRAARVLGLRPRQGRGHLGADDHLH